MKQRRKLASCLNCQTEMDESINFCPSCGQENHQKKASLKILVNDFVSDYFTFDSKFFRSAKQLLFKPGALTVAYRDGKRKSFITPIRLYLFTSFLYFFCMQFALDFDNGTNGVTLNGKAINQELALEAEEEYGSIDAFVDQEFSDISGIGRLMFKKSITIIKNGENLVQYWVGNMSLMALILLPIFAWVFMLLFRRSKEFYVIHLIHVTHLQSFTYLLLIAFLLVGQLFQNAAIIMLFTIMPVYLFISLKRVYNRSTGATIYKSVMSIFWYLVVLILGMLSTLAVSLLFA